MGAIRVAVCDDDMQDLVEVLALIRQYDREQQLQITTLFHASALLEQKDSFDIAFLDIEMEPPNGYDIAKKLAAMEHRPVVIFVTKSSAYTIRGSFSSRCRISGIVNTSQRECHGNSIYFLRFENPLKRC